MAKEGCILIRKEGLFPTSELGLSQCRSAIRDEYSNQHNASDEESGKIPSSLFEDSEPEEKVDVNLVSLHSACMWNVS